MRQLADERLEGARPRFETPAGDPPPPALRVLDRALRGPAPVQAVALRVAVRSVLRRLPPLIGHYPDGRAFLARGSDSMYAWVFLLGEWEPLESAVLRAVLREGDLCVDVGANDGWHTLVMAAATRPGGAVLAVEPLPDAVARLRSNLARNTWADSVEVHTVALGADAGEVELNVFDDLPPGYASTSTLGRSDARSTLVTRMTLDELVAARARRPTVVKVDVEGGELDVLRGARELRAAPDAPMWLVEVNYETAAAFGYAPVDLLSELRAGREHTVLRLGGGVLRREADAETAGQGDSWLCVPANHRDRVERFLSRTPR